MMAAYFHGGSEIQAGVGENLQTLYLMNPNYISAYSESHHQQNNQTSPNMLLINQQAGGIGHAPLQHHQSGQQLIGIPLSDNPNRPSPHHNHHDHQIPPSLQGLAVSRAQYNLWSPTAVDPNPTPAQQQGGLSLSLSPQQQNHPGSGVVTVAAGGGGGGGSRGTILGSKYLKAAQELLDEVVNVGHDYNNRQGGDQSSGAHKEKAKAATSSVVGGESSSGGSKRDAAEQLTTAQRQELQMKKAKLLNMLDEVEQRYRQYHTQMQVVVSSFEQAAGIGSAKSYTSLALQTISRQFRCLKDAIASQIKATSKSLGEEDSSSGGQGGKLEGGAGSRLRFVDHQLRQQRALQQLGMMQHNAWRPQRGLPERAVSVLRAWLFEHFLHPYPKDSDKHMLAKQTGLTRSQVSNWFINARVRLWKPMVEEMYMEEMKTQEQNGGNISENTTTNNNNNDHNKDQSTATAPKHHHRGGAGDISVIRSTPQQPTEHQTTTTNDMISNLSSMSTTTSQAGGFTLIGSSSDMESLIAGRSPKKQRSGGSDMQNSPSSILSMDMEMKPPDQHHHQTTRDHQVNKFGFSGLNNPSNAGGTGPPTGFNHPYIVNNDMGRFNPDHHLAPPHHQYHGNNGVSLTLGLPHCENLSSLSGNHPQSFLPSQGMQLGRRLDVGAGEADFCGISMGQPSHPTNNAYETIDIQNRKRFAAQLLHDFVA